MFKALHIYYCCHAYNNPIRWVNIIIPLVQMGRLRACLRLFHELTIEAKFEPRTSRFTAQSLGPYATPTGQLPLLSLALGKKWVERYGGSKLPPRVCWENGIENGTSLECPQVILAGQTPPPPPKCTLCLPGGKLELVFVSEK